MEVKHLNYDIRDGAVCFNVPKSEEDRIVSYTLDGHVFFHHKVPSGYFGGWWVKHGLIYFWEKNPSMNLEVKWHTFRDNKKVNTELFYIHPMRTGGSSIESIGFEYGVEWGFLYKCGKQTNFDPHESSYYFTQLDYLKDKVLFTSVRNPYSRVVSIFYSPLNLPHDIKQIKTKEEFNNRLKEKIEVMSPCYDFVYHNDKKVIPHVIKMEDGLNEGFDKLMFDYNCPVRLNNTHVNKSHIERKKWSVDDINPANIDLINKRYEKDFEYFGYTMK